MLNYLNEMNRDDLYRSFEGTYLLANINGVSRAVKCHSFNARDSIGVVVVGSRANMELPLEYFDLEQPDLGMFWFKGDLYYAARNVERQWRRGFRMRSVSIYKLQADGNVSKVQNSALERHVVLHFFEGGLAHDNILSRDFGRRGNLLYFRTIPVGTIKGNKIVLEYDIDINLEGYEICQK